MAVKLHEPIPPALQDFVLATNRRLAQIERRLDVLALRVRAQAPTSLPETIFDQEADE
jgi:hypothetical protein